MSKKKKRGWPALPQPLQRPVIDNHTHLPLVPYEVPRRMGQRLTLDAQLARAKAVGVSAVITSACELPDIEPAISQAARFDGRVDAPRIYVAAAIHPNEAALHAGVVETSPDGWTHDLEPHHRAYDVHAAAAYVSDCARQHDRVVAIGETGLDYFRTSEAGRAAQKESFADHIAIAKELDLPLQIHDRDAHEDTVAVLRECGAPKRTVFHCFSGDEKLAEICRDNGWYASFSGTVTFNANDYLRRALDVLPRELVMVETDAPYLTPQPHRGQPNASYVIAHTVRYIAQLWGIDEGQAADLLTSTTQTVYELDLQCDDVHKNLK